MNTYQNICQNVNFYTKGHTFYTSKKLIGIVYSGIKVYQAYPAVDDLDSSLYFENSILVVLALICFRKID